MRRIATCLITVGALAGLGFSTGADDGVPRRVNIVAACNASQSPNVQPQRIQIERIDHVEWVENSGRATSWTITPKDTLAWPFGSRSFTGSRGGSATSPTPTGGQDGVAYRYNVTINCEDGSVQRIDPDIVIGPIGDR